MTLKKKIIAILSAIIVLLGGATVANLGSVGVASEYNATTTRNAVGTALTNLTVLSDAPTTLGSVTITGAAAGVINLYDATTTNVSLRTGATSTLTVISVPASAAAGTYTFDMVFKNGLIYEMVGTAPTSTITWRAR